jgi:hypothetical protein
VNSANREKILREALAQYPAGTVVGFNDAGQLIIQLFHGEREEKVEPVVQWVQAMARTPPPEVNTIPVVVDASIMEDWQQDRMPGKPKKRTRKKDG